MKKLHPVFVIWLAAVLIVGVGELLPASSLHQIHYDSLNLDDKAVHFFNYTVLAVLPMIAFRFSRTAVLWAVMMIPFGGLLELFQMLVPGRTAEWGDFLANSLGVAMGVLLGFAWKAAKSEFA